MSESLPGPAKQVSDARGENEAAAPHTETTWAGSPDAISADHPSSFSTGPDFSASRTWEASRRGVRLVRRSTAQGAALLRDERTRRGARQCLQFAVLASAAVVARKKRVNGQRAATEAMPDRPAWAALWAAAEAEITPPLPPAVPAAGTAGTLGRKPWLDALDAPREPEADGFAADQPDEAWSVLTPSVGEMFRALDEAGRTSRRQAGHLKA